MGMFDWVDAPPIKCYCGEEVSGWQSKDGPCLMGTLPRAMVNRYYSQCDKCKTWHEFKRPMPDPMPEFEHIAEKKFTPSP